MSALFRVDWVPGSDDLVGTCHCGAVKITDDPIEIWHWLLGHPAGHDHAQPDRGERLLVTVGR